MSYTRTLKITVPNDATTLALPSLKKDGAVKEVFVRNIGLLDLHMYFEDDASGDYITVKAGEVSPIFSGLAGNELLYLDGVGGSTTIEVMIWEK